MKIPPEGFDMSRRRTVIQAQPRPSFALIGAPTEAFRALIRQYGTYRVFPTFTRFLSAERRRWAGVLVLRADTWHPDLEIEARGRRRIVLVDPQRPGHWPNHIAVARGTIELRTWLDHVALPPVASTLTGTPRALTRQTNHTPRRMPAPKDADQNLWASLRLSVPKELHSAPLSRVPWTRYQAERIVRISRALDVHTVESLFALDATRAGGNWDTRACDALLDSLLRTRSGRPVAPQQALTFAAMRDSLLEAMPSEEAALSLRSGSCEVALPATRQALRFYAQMLARLRALLMGTLDEPIALKVLQLSEPYFTDLVSLGELETFARAALGLRLYVTSDTQGTARITSRRPAPSRRVRARRPLIIPEYAELRGIRDVIEDGDRAG